MGVDPDRNKQLPPNASVSGGRSIGSDSVGLIVKGSRWHGAGEPLSLKRSRDAWILSIDANAVTNRNLFPENGVCRLTLPMPLIRFRPRGADVECFPGRICVKRLGPAARASRGSMPFKGKLATAAGCGQCITLLSGGRCPGGDSTGAQVPAPAVEDRKLQKRSSRLAPGLSGHWWKHSVVVA